MAKAVARTLEVKTSVAAGAGTQTADLTSCEVQVAGTFSATLKIQGSNDNATWVDIATVTSAGLTAVSKKWAWLRANTTVYASGTPTVSVGGRKERSKLIALEVKASVAAGAAQGIYELDTNRSLHVVNPGTATLSLEGSMDGTTWTTDQDVSAGGQFDVTKPWTYIRINTTVYSSGAPSAVIVGKRIARFQAVRTLDTTVPVATPSTPTVAQKTGGTPGTTHYGYKIVAKNAAGHSAASAEGTDILGAATLTSADAEVVTWTAVTGATGYDVYRTTGGTTQGLIASVGVVVTYTDDGTTDLTATGTAPTARTSADLDIYVGDMDTMQVVTQGAQSGNLDVEGSVDGVTFKKIGSSITGAGVFTSANAITLLRLRLTWSSYTSGTPTAVVVGNLPTESVPS